MLADGAINETHEGRWLTLDLLGGDITNPQSLNRYAYVLNNPTTLTDPSGLGPQDCSDPNYFFSHAECGGTPGCVAEGSEGCIPYPVGYPIGGDGGDGGGGTSGSTTMVAVNPPAASPTGTFSGTFGGPSGFVSNAQVIEQIGGYASPWEIDILSVCAFTPVCRAVLLGAAAGVAVRRLLYPI